MSLASTSRVHTKKKHGVKREVSTKSPTVHFMPFTTILYTCETNTPQLVHDLSPPKVISNPIKAIGGELACKLKEGRKKGRALNLWHTPTLVD